MVVLTDGLETGHFAALNQFGRPATWRGRHGACRIARRIPGARVVRSQRRFASSNRDGFCEFELDGVTFIIEEPFGDNSRYWIGPNPAHYMAQTAVVRDIFARAGPWGLFVRAAG
jgi:hypothetical protein